MCTFSGQSRMRLGNAVMFVAAHAKYPYKTEVLKLLFLMEERMVQKYHVPMLSIPFCAWRMGPVSVDVFEELSDGPVLLADFVTLQFNGQGIKVTPSRKFDEDEFSDAELEVMHEVMERYGDMNSEQLIELTHREGSLWRETAKEHGLLEDFEQKRANSSTVVIDMARFLTPADQENYEKARELQDFANKLRVEHARCEVQGLSEKQTADMLKERLGLIDLETMRQNLHQMVKQVYAQP